MLDPHRLKLLRELHRRGTLAAVAEALSYSPSSVSQQLATLEREAGVQLLEPFGRRVRLTPQAEILVEHAELLLEDLECAEAALAASQEHVTGTVRIAAFQTAALKLVPAAITRLAHQHPYLRTEVTEVNAELALPALLAGDFDLVMTEEYPHHPLPQPRQTGRVQLLADELYLVVPKSWKERRLGDLADRPFVMESTGTTARQWATAQCRNAGFEPDIRYNSTDLGVHLRIVEEGLAAALLPRLAGAQGHDGVRVHRLDDRPQRLIYATVRRGAQGHPRIQAFIEALHWRARQPRIV